MASFDLTGTTHFLNVDLDVTSRSRLEPLAAAFGDAVSVLYVGGTARLFQAHFEIADSFEKDADAVINELVVLVRKLPSSARGLWNGAKSRDFNIGIQSAAHPHSHELRLNPDTLAAVARVNGCVVITTYAPLVAAPARNPRGSKRAAASLRK